jgi:transcriptional regulator with XRE-family HTH domain
MGSMGYTEKLQRLCALRGLDQAALAKDLGLSKSSISRILSGTQEPKLRIAYELARRLNVTVDYLMDESADIGPNDRLMMLSEDEATILKIVRRLGNEASFHRLINIPELSPRPDPEP